MTKRKCSNTAAERALRRRSRIQSSFEHLVEGALALLPRLIDDCPPQVAATVITDLLRIHLGRPLPEIPEPNCLECLIEELEKDPANLESADPPVQPMSLPAEGSPDSHSDLPTLNSKP